MNYILNELLRKLRLILSILGQVNLVARSFAFLQDNANVYGKQSDRHQNYNSLLICNPALQTRAL